MQSKSFDNMRTSVIVFLMVASFGCSRNTPVKVIPTTTSAERASSIDSEIFLPREAQWKDIKGPIHFMVAPLSEIVEVRNGIVENVTLKRLLDSVILEGRDPAWIRVEDSNWRRAPLHRSKNSNWMYITE